MNLTDAQVDELNLDPKVRFARKRYFARLAEALKSGDPRRVKRVHATSGKSYLRIFQNKLKDLKI